MIPTTISEAFETELLPCPFCGGQAVFDVYSATANTASTYGGGSFVRYDFDIKCKACGTAAPRNGSAYRVKIDFDKSGTITIEDGRELAAEAWNARGEEPDDGGDTEPDNGGGDA